MMIPTGFKFYTWVDILEYFIYLKESQSWPDDLISISAYWDGITLNIKPNKKANIVSWLIDNFDPRFIETKESLLLQDDKTQLKFYFEELEVSPQSQNMRPTLTKTATIYRTDTIPKLTEFDESAPSIFAFHSFKGGVGRTIHAIALAKKIVDSGGKVLLIDADFEAPGISYLVYGNIDISYADFLALAHSDETIDASNTIDLVSNKLLNQKREKEIFILPAYRSKSQFANLDVKPDDIILNYENGYILPELIMGIAKKLGVNAIIVDLRAGLSELSAGFLLDPRVTKVLVTTLSGQSIEGTKQVLKIIGESIDKFKSTSPSPSVIITQIPDESFVDQDFIIKTESDISDSFFETNKATPDSEFQIDNLNFIESAFTSDLLVLSSNWDSVIEKLMKVQLPEKLLELVPVIKKADESINWDERREKLFNLTEKMIFAESGKVSTFFWTNPLLNIANDYSNKNPSLVIIGPKGSGKTLVFFELMRSNTWGEFVSKSKKISNYESFIVPILEPKSQEDQARKLVNDRRKNIATLLNLPLLTEVVSDYILECLTKNLNDAQWRDIWLNAIAYSNGFGTFKQGDPGRDFIKFLKEGKKKIVAVFDGIEDLFQDIENNSEQQKAVRALIYELPGWLEQQPETPIGIVVLVRRDFVDISIKQNKDQFVSKYNSYALKWNLDEALRLAGFIAQKSLNFPEGEIESMNRNTLLSSLEPLWGKRLSYASSREAHSANWIFTALSDWNGQIQARDLVRFIKTAAESSLREKSKESRVLTIQAVKKAVEECSVAKVDEVSRENKVLNAIFLKIKAISTHKETPISSLQELNIDSNETMILINEGVLYKPKIKSGKEEYHIAEIYRSGLHFNYKGRKMTKVLAYRKAFEI